MFKAPVRLFILTGICSLCTFAGPAAAGFHGFDTSTQGNWKGVYGTDGYIIANDSNAPPAYVTVNASGATSYTWISSTTDPRALLKGASTTDRIESTYYSASTFSFDVNLTDGQTHQLALYCLDADRGGRSERISILDAGSNAVLDTESVSNFQNGVYAIWNVQGHVTVQVTYTGGLNAVVSGLFFGAGSANQRAAFQQFDNTTEGTWKGVYGLDGYIIANDSNAPPAYAVVSTSGASLYTWSASTSDGRALQKGSSTTDRIASTYYTGGSFTFDVNLTDGQTHRVALYCLDDDSTSRTEKISILDAGTNGVLDAENLSNFHNGVYAVWNLQGHVLIQVTNTSSSNAVASALFFGAGGTTQTAAPTVSISNPTGGTVAGPVTLTATANSSVGIASVQFQLDGSNFGSPVSGAGPVFSTSWDTTSGSNGPHSITAIATDSLGQSATSSAAMVTVANGTARSAAFVKFDTATQGTWKGAYGGDGYLIANDSSNLPGYATVNASGASLYTWLGSTSDPRALQKGSSLTDRIASTYYSGTTFTYDVNLTDGQSHQLAVYCLDWDSTGRAQKISILDATTNAVLDAESLSNFHNGIYAVWNVQGHVIVQVTYTGGLNAVAGGLFFGTGTSGGGSSSSPPAVSVVSPTGGTVSGTTTVTANATSSVGIASVQFQVDGSNLGAAVTGTGPAFSAQWITTSATNGTHTLIAIATDNLGLHTTSAGVTVTITNAASTSAAAFLKFDSTTAGTWKRTYGADGYIIASDSNNPPAYGTVNITGASPFTWLSSTTELRGLQKGASTTDRIVSAYYSATSFTFDINLTDGQTHQVALYCLDYDNSVRSERISIQDASTNAVLDTQNLSNFQNGIYAIWNLQGHVLIQVTRTGGPNALVNGVFFGGAAVAPPALAISTNALSFSSTTGSGSLAQQNIAISNVGGGTLNWTANKTQSWLTLGAVSGTAPSTLGIGVNIMGLAAGSYTDTVTINGAGAGASPQTVTVALVLEAPVTNGAIANWTFEAATLPGGTVLDTSGNSLDGTIHGGVTPAAGKIGQGVAFDGSTGYIVTAPSPAPAMAGDLTLAAWIKTTNASRVETILSKYDTSGSEDGYVFETTADGYLALHLGGSDINGNRDIVDGSNRINDGQWHQVALIIRTGQDASFYVDGGLSSVDYLSINRGAFGSPVTIGDAVPGASNFFTGSMDEVRIYNRAINTSEVTGLFGGTVTTVPGGQILSNGIAMPKNFPPPTLPTQMQRTPYYINNPPAVIPIDMGRQLFVDDFLIEQTTLQRTPHQPSMYPNPVLAPGSPISGGAWFDPSSQLYKMWYYNTTNDYRYAYSTDGKNWTLPSIPDALVPNTNEVVTGGDTVWLDLQETNPARRYKSFGVDVGALKIYVYFSADGVHWTGRQAYDINTLSDRTTVFWNPFRGEWVNSDRGTAGFPASANRAAQASRARFYSESKDLTTWTPSDPSQTFWTGADDQDPPYYLNNPGGQPPELYDLDCVAYENVMVGLFSWFYPGIGYNSYTLPGPILVEEGVGFSRDGFSWLRPTRGSGPNGAFIPASNIAGTWNAYNTQSVGGGFLVVGDELWFYFSGRTLQKPLDGTFSTGLATLRRDGFYSMDAGTTQGTLVTHPVRFSGGHLFVNVKDPTGLLQVDVLDANGNVIQPFSAANCIPLSVDKTLQEVTWGGASLATLAGQTVKFRFSLSNGSLYSFWVSASAQGASNGYVAAGGPGFTGVTDTVGAAGYPGGVH
ncbi:MAG TPA: LamG-like jellyroll fold domain-containing protein [Bryobacteraceae bacterium]|jgi:hypothetical protein